MHGIVREIVERCGKDKKWELKIDIKRNWENSVLIYISDRIETNRDSGSIRVWKSMTLKSIAGIETPDFGMIQIDDKVLLDSANKVDLKPQKRNVGYLFQNYALFPTMTVAKNIAAS